MQTNKDYSDLEKVIDYKFKNRKLLATAFTHRSFLNEFKTYSQDAEKFPENNERLEFLGDAVLELIVTENLFKMHEDRSEGELTSFRAAVVRTESLAETALALNFGDLINMSRGEEATGGRNRPYILANTFEAFLGAMYLDSGLKECEKFVNAFLLPKLAEIIAKRLDIDSKSKLQELAQEKFKFTPVYEVIGESGPDHDRTFTVKVIIQGEEKGQGQGKSKQEAEQRAATAALEVITG